MPETDPREELATLTAALRAHLEVSRAAGTFGLPAASPELAAARARAAVSEGTMEAPPPAAPAKSADVASVRSAEEASRARPPTLGNVPGLAHSASGADRVARLTVLATEAGACTRCGLHASRKQAVFSRGTASSGLVFVGEGPGADEDDQGFPFVGKAGQLLDKMIEAMGFARDDIYVCNIVKCRPPNNRKPEPSEVLACRPFLAEQLDLVEPKVIVALGATAVEGLLGITGGITRLRGTWRLYRGTIPVMPTFHPAYLLRTPEAKRDVWNDLQEVVRHMGRTLPPKR